MASGDKGYLVAKIAVSCTAYHYDSLYSYSVPQEMRSKLKAGIRVIVPFGMGNVKRIGFVARTYESDSCNPELKPIYKLLESEPLVSDELLRLIDWLKDNTFCTYFDAYRSIVPAGFSYSFTQRYSLANMEIDCELTEEESSLVEFLRQAVSPKEIDSLLDFTGNPRKKAVVQGLIDKGVVELHDKVRRRVGDETVRMIALTDGYLDDAGSFKLTPKQKKAAEFLEENSSASVKELCYATGVTQTIVRNLVNSGAAYEYEYETLRSVAVRSTGSERLEDIRLNEEQKRAFDGIAELVDERKPAGALLYGVTGSGKTSVFIKLIEHTLSIGRNAMLLIPEISLTPQTVGRFRTLFGDTVAVVHSNLSLGQRVDEFKRLKSGEARIAVGTRSAVFAPLENIGIIIIDEEGEHSYKSESSPRYHAREVAIQRCGYNNCLLLMASATPSLKSYYYAQKGRFHFFELKHRFSGTKLPQVVTVDMEEEREQGCDSPLSPLLVNEISAALQRKEQVILLLNRRGFSEHFTCQECRKVVSCPNCSIPLTYHKVNGRLMCHYCGYSGSANAAVCECGSNEFIPAGTGTQRVEDILAELFPKARLLRMDADTASSRFAYDRSFEEFSKGNYDIMLGTQMIAKGIDFPSVTLVGVLSVDRQLYMGDYAAAERTFSLITQVVGRGGRGDKQGLAVLQTSSPEHYVIELGARQDYKSFYRQELEFRKAQIYPPFCDICIVCFNCIFEDRARDAARSFAKMLAGNLEDCGQKLPLCILGPSPCSVGKISNRYRYRLILKCKNNRATRKLVADTLVMFGKKRDFSNVRVYADMNGEII